MQASKPLRRFFAALCLALAVPSFASTEGGHKHKPARAELGTSAAFDAGGRLWIAGKAAVEGGAYVILQVSEDLGKSWSAPKRVQASPEPVSADGENRPKLAFGRQGEIYVSYTRPLSRPYTGEIRFARSADGGKTFEAPVTVHANRDLITHRFDSIAVDRSGRVYIAWIDKRDMEAAKARGEKYAGAALYYAVSDDAGKTFRGDFKIADHSCECCRIALVPGPRDGVTALWRHVFDGDMRDHALAVLGPEGKPATVQRATFDGWKVNACPHHGPSMALTEDGRRHQVWFNVKDGEGGVFYAAVRPDGRPAKQVRLGSAQAAHADIVANGKRIAIAWKQFDGTSTSVRARISQDGGRTWREREVARTGGNSDQPRLAAGKPGIVLVWRTQDEGVQTVLLK